jgi:hypothetical protein
MRPVRLLLRRALPVVVSAGALALLLARVDAAAVLRTLSLQVALVVIPAYAVYGGLTLALEALSILRLVEDRPPALSAWSAARAKSASYLLGTLHYALGIGALAILLRRLAGLPLGRAAGVVLAISAADLLVLLVLAAGAAGALGLELPAAQALAAALALAAAGLALLRAPVPLGPLEPLRGLAFLEALRSASPRALAELLALRALFACAFVALAGAAFAAFDLAPGLARLVGGMMMVACVGALPIAVAGLGTGQAAFLAAFHGVAEPEILLALSLVLSAGMIALRVGMGLLFAREYAREAAAEWRKPRAGL